MGQTTVQILWCLPLLFSVEGLYNILAVHWLATPTTNKSKSFLKINQVNSGSNDPGRRKARATAGPSGLIFFRVHCASFHIFTLLFLPSSSISLSFSIVDVPVPKSSGERSRMSSAFL